MPRLLNFSVPQLSQDSEVRLDAPIHGVFEITEEERNRLFAMAPHCNFHSQFCFEGPQNQYSEAKDSTSVVCIGDAAHAWLSENTTGPWYWSEDWNNHGHSLQANLFIERLSDQKAFLEKFQTSCRYTPNDAEQLDELAVLRGVLPNLSVNESLLAWIEANRGFKLEQLGASDWSLTFTISELQLTFDAEWGHLFTKHIIEGQPNTYVGPMPDEPNRGKLLWWLIQDHGVTFFSGFVKEASGKVAFSETVRYPSVIEAFKKDLRELITRDEGNGTFILHALQIPPRKIPDDFMAYLQGDREDYESPHLQR